MNHRWGRPKHSDVEQAALIQFIPVFSETLLYHLDSSVVGCGVSMY